jgi:signal transduction histidine kinase/ActR/RegA family two-component response regulator
LALPIDKGDDEFVRAPLVQAGRFPARGVNMHAFRDTSIKRKLVRIIMLTTMVALLLACSVILPYELIAYHRIVTRQVGILAQLVSQGSTAALAFNDRQSASETLATLRAEPYIVSACIYTNDGRPFAAYLRAESRRDLPRRPGKDGTEFRDGHLILFQQIVFDGQRVGTVYVKRDLRDMYACLERYGGILLAILLAASLAAFLLSSKLQRVISEPVLELAAMAGRVSAERNYSLRAVKIGDDELGALVDRFNEMMAQIQARSLEVLAARNALQQHVQELCVEIAERQRIQEELLAAKQAAEDSSRAKSTFLANMSHELRTPLNAIIGYSEMLQEDARDNQQIERIPDLARITTAGKHLLTLITDVLDLSKVEAGKTELLLEDAAISQILEDTIDTMAPLARQNGDTLTMRCAPGLTTVRVDAGKLRQSLYNLVSNACKFAENGAVSIEVVPVTADGANWIEWRVSDSGIGIAPHQMHKLFRAFSQVDASTTRKYGGTGLGLAISQRFCQLMGGAISVSSEPGKGSTFTIRLPRAERSRALETPPAAPDTTAGRREPRQNTVLVIDDDPTVQDLLSRSLTREGFEVVLACGGQEGLRKAREVYPAAITLDVLMPGADGWSVLSALKADPELAGIPVILYTITDNRNLAYILGASEYLQKPVEPERLAAALRKYQAGKPVDPVLVGDRSRGRPRRPRARSRAKAWADFVGSDDAWHGRI